MKIHLKHAFLISLFSIFVIPQTAYANIGIPMIFLGVPFMALALVPVIIVEAYIYNKELNAPPKESTISSIVSNVVTTILGYPFSWALHLALMFVVVYPVSFIILKLNVKNIPQWLETIMTLLSITLGGAWLMPNVRPWMITVAGMFALVPAFFVSYYVEKKIVKRFLTEQTEGKIKQAVWKANKTTYQLLFLVLLIVLIYQFTTGSSYAGDILTPR